MAWISRHRSAISLGEGSCGCAMSVVPNLECCIPINQTRPNERRDNLGLLLAKSSRLAVHDHDRRPVTGTVHKDLTTRWRAIHGDNPTRLTIVAIEWRTADFSPSDVIDEPPCFPSAATGQMNQKFSEVCQCFLCCCLHFSVSFRSKFEEQFCLVSFGLVSAFFRMSSKNEELPYYIGGSSCISELKELRRTVLQSSSKFFEVLRSLSMPI